MNASAMTERNICTTRRGILCVTSTSAISSAVAVADTGIISANKKGDMAESVMLTHSRLHHRGDSVISQGCR